MHLNYAEIFGVESLSLNKHFSKPIQNNEHNNSSMPLHLPEQLQSDLINAIELLNTDGTKAYRIVAQEVNRYDVIQADTISVSVSHKGLSAEDKKHLWQTLMNTFKVDCDN